MSTSIERRKYMLQRLRLLHDGKVLVGTPEEYMEQHDRAYEDLLRARAVHRPAFAADNLDLVGGAIEAAGRCDPVETVAKQRNYGK